MSFGYASSSPAVKAGRNVPGAGRTAPSGQPSSRTIPSNLKPLSRAVAAGSAPAGRQGTPDRNPSGDFTPVSVLDLRAGQRIEHNRFGLGTIVEISGSGTDLKAKIDFDASGVKILLLKYAKIRLA